MFLRVLLLACLLASAAIYGPAQPRSNRSITFVSEPNATIWIDGVRYGETGANGRLTIKTVSPGAHTIRIRASGFAEISKAVTAVQKGEISFPLKKTADAAEIAYQQAELLAHTDRARAVESYKKAIASRGSYPEAFLGLARVYSEMSDPENALNAIRNARRLRPGYAEASAVEGRIYKDGGDEAKAVAAFNRAIKEGRTFQPEAYTGLGLLYKDKAEAAASESDFDGESQNYTLAAKYLQAAVKQLSGAPDAIVVYQLLGLVYEKQKKYQQAIDVYREFLNIFPESDEASAVQSYIVQIEKQMKEPK